MITALLGYRMLLTMIALLALLFGCNDRFNATGAPWIIFTIAIGFLAVIEALVATTATSVDAAAVRAAASAKERKAIADTLSAKSAPR